MKTIEIQIRKNSRDNLSAIFVENGRVDSFNTLFEFAYRKGMQDMGYKPSWHFWLNHSSHSSHRTNGERRDFPMAFFLDACKAKYFLHPRGGEIPDDVKITYGLGHIGIRNNNQ